MSTDPKETALAAGSSHNPGERLPISYWLAGNVRPLLFPRAEDGHIVPGRMTAPRRTVRRRSLYEGIHAGPRALLYSLLSLSHPAPTHANHPGSRLIWS